MGTYTGFADMDNDLSTVTIKDSKADRKTYTCQHCAGTGKWSGGTNRLGNSSCIPCNGRGHFVTSPDFRAKQRQNVKDRSQRSQEEKRQASRAAMCEQVGDENVTMIEQFLSDNLWSDFFSSLYSQLQQRGALSEKQLACVLKSIAKTDDRAEAKAAATPKAQIIDAALLIEKFQTAIDSGLKRPKLTVGDLKFSKAPDHGRNAGFLYVKHMGEYVGKIDPDGAIVIYKDDIKQMVIDTIENLSEAVRAHGQKTGQCGCCNRELTNPDSIALGIGPICAAKWGM